MPQSWPVNPDDPFMQLKENDIDDVQSSNLRGNLEWAPPRPQIVFAVYSSPKFVTIYRYIVKPESKKFMFSV